MSGGGDGVAINSRRMVSYTASTPTINTTTNTTRGRAYTTPTFIVFYYYY